MHACMRACMCACVRACMSMHTCVHACVRACVRACPGTRARMHACVRACVRLCMSMPTCVHAGGRGCPCVRACMHVCVCVFLAPEPPEAYLCSATMGMYWTKENHHHFQTNRKSQSCFLKSDKNLGFFQKHKKPKRWTNYGQVYIEYRHSWLRVWVLGLFRKPTVLITF